MNLLTTLGRDIYKEADNEILDLFYSCEIISVKRDTVKWNAERAMRWFETITVTNLLQPFIMMKPFTRHTGLVVPMDRSDVDTDQIIPKQFLKRIERTGFGKFAFYDWRYKDEKLTPNPDFVLNKPEYQGAAILLARKNFGCGSSREHAPWALDDFGFRVVLALSFADIFYNNCFKNGLLPIRLSEEQINELFKREAANRPLKLTIDLEAGIISDEKGLSIPFEIDAFRKNRLIAGLDDIGVTLQNEAKITAYEKTHGIV